MTEALTNPMSVDLRLQKEDFQQKEQSLFYANQKAIIFLLFIANLSCILLFWQHSYPIMYPIITFTYRKVKFYAINNSLLQPYGLSYMWKINTTQQKSRIAFTNQNLISRVKEMRHIQNQSTTEQRIFQVRPEPNFSKPMFG